MAVTNVYDLGDKPTLAYTLRDSDGDPIAGASVTAKALSPSGVATTPTVTDEGLGVYSIALLLDEVGRWYVEFTAPAPNDEVEPYELVVRSSRFDATVDRSDAAYAEVDDVARLAQGRTFSATSRPSTSEVVDFLALTAGHIDARLRAQGYSVPVSATAAAARRVLAHTNALGAAHLVEQAAPTTTDTRLAAARRLWEDALKALTSDMELDADRDTASARPRYQGAATAMFSIGMSH